MRKREWVRREGDRERGEQEDVLVCFNAGCRQESTCGACTSDPSRSSRSFVSLLPSSFFSLLSSLFPLPSSLFFLLSSFIILLCSLSSLFSPLSSLSLLFFDKQRSIERNGVMVGLSREQLEGFHEWCKREEGEQGGQNETFTVDNQVCSSLSLLPLYHSPLFPPPSLYPSLSSFSPSLLSPLPLLSPLFLLPLSPSPLLPFSPLPSTPLPLSLFTLPLSPLLSSLSLPPLLPPPLSSLF